MRHLSFYSSFFVFLVVSIGFGESSIANPNCPQDHCSKISENMNRFCIANGFSGKPYLVLSPNGGECLCPCSCMASNTLVTMEAAQTWREVESLGVGEVIFSPYSDRAMSPIDQILMSDFSVKPGKVRHLSFSNGTQITVSPEHTFIAPEMRVRAAEELKIGQSIFDESYQEVLVVKNEEDSRFHGKLMNLIINAQSTKASDHFIATNSVISGDWLVQSNYASFHADIDVRMGQIKTFRD